MEREPKIYDLRDIDSLAEIHVDMHGDTVIPVKNGDRVVLSPEVAEEVWRLTEKERAKETVSLRINIEGDDELAGNLDWLANTYTDTKEALIAPLESFICEQVLKEFDLQMLEPEEG